MSRNGKSRAEASQRKAGLTRHHARIPEIQDAIALTLSLKQFLPPHPLRVRRIADLRPLRTLREVGVLLALRHNALQVPRFHSREGHVSGYGWMQEQRTPYRGVPAYTRQVCIPLKDRKAPARLWPVSLDCPRACTCRQLPVQASTSDRNNLRVRDRRTSERFQRRWVCRISSTNLVQIEGPSAHPGRRSSLLFLLEPALQTAHRVHACGVQWPAQL